ncbi:uncharacterized protein A4U43_C07F31750 [Asparagus officinalis]|uniref:Uncharacterized protein n=1 Tax=Asparagus officinalis TaxID=4686 RepID=A0A5P1EID0_ASPOF|nr:uncharacterized protein A4U43_C07F31750 [Asparagus officinalis]
MEARPVRRGRRAARGWLVEKQESPGVLPGGKRGGGGRALARRLPLSYGDWQARGDLIGNWDVRNLGVDGGPRAAVLRRDVGLARISSSVQRAVQGMAAAGGLKALDIRGTCAVMRPSPVRVGRG